MKFLLDTPASKDELKTHTHIAQAILSHVEIEHQASFVIGLFGDWGTGKTSIVRWFKDLISKNGDIAFAEVDAWQAGEKFFGISFLKAIVYQCIGDKVRREEILKKIATKQSTTTSHPEVKNGKTYLITLGTLFLIAIYLLPNLYLFVDPDFPWVNIAAFLFGGGLFLLAQFYINNFAISSKITEEDISVEQADRFQKILIEDVFKSVKEPICCVVVDNIDRLEAKEALDVIRKLKTYIIDDRKLQKQGKQFVIIVPVDDHLLVRHIEDFYQNEEDKGNGRQFIRKFFNISIRIPETLRTDLYQFTESQLRVAYENDDLPANFGDIAFIFNRAANLNPRDIKNLINEYISLQLILGTMEKDSTVADLKENPHWVAFFVAYSFLSGYTNLPNTLASLETHVDEPKFFPNQRDLIKRIKEFVSATSHIWSLMPETVWQFLRHYKISNNLLRFPFFPELQQHFTNREAADAMKFINVLDSIDIPGLLNALVLESSGDQNSLLNISETSIRMTELGLDVEKLPPRIIDTANFLLRPGGTNPVSLVCGPLVNVVERLGIDSIRNAIEIARETGKLYSEGSDAAQIEGEIKEPDWMEFLHRYLEKLKANSKLPKIPSSAMSICIRYNSKFAAKLVEDPNLIPTSTVLSALVNRLETDNSFFPPTEAREFISKLGEENSSSFFSEHLATFKARIEQTVSPQTRMTSTEYTLAIALIAMENGKLQPVLLPQSQLIIDQILTHLESRDTAEDRFLAMMVVNAIKALQPLSEGDRHRCAAIQERLGPGIYKQVSPSMLLQNFKDFPSVVAEIPESYLVEIGKINEELFNFVLNLDSPVSKAISKQLFRHSSQWSRNRLKPSRDISERVSFLEDLLVKAEENQFSIISYSEWKEVTKGKQPKEIKLLIQNHYSKIISSIDFSVPANVTLLTRIVNLFRVIPTKEQQDQIMGKLTSISVTGFKDEISLLQSVMRGNYYVDKEISKKPS